MLLPSALSCDSGLFQPVPQRSTRPKLLSFDRYDPLQRSQSPVLGLIASCRALQGMLGERFASTPPPTHDSKLRARTLASPFGQPVSSPFCPPAPRGTNKRRRDDLEEDGATALEESRATQAHANIFSTPKRRRIVPLDLPPGLQASDFEALTDTTSLPSKLSGYQRPNQDIDMPTPEASDASPEERSSYTSWTDNDDKLLVEVVLSKLNLSSREWNDCAVRLGKDKDSIGRRWRLLVGEGNVGLRRGSGRMARPELDIKSW